MSASPTDAQSIVLQWALWYAGRGFRVFPIKALMKSPPLITAWPQRASADPDQVRSWWSQWPDANIGIALGGGHLVVDCDYRKTGCRQALAALEEKHGALPTTATAQTPSGGEHRLFSGIDVLSRANSLGPGLDVKSQGGYVLAAPSTTIAVDGKQSAGRYKWVDPNAPIAPAPAWLIAAAGSPKPLASPASVPTPRIELQAHQIADVMSALEHMTTVSDVARNDLWSEIGYTLLSLGDQGRELWCEWSERAPGYGGTTGPEEWWDAHRAERARSDYRHLFTIARQHGWSNPIHSVDPTQVGLGRSSLPPGVTPAPLATADNPYLAERLSAADFYSISATGRYLYLPTGQDWPAKSVDKRVGSGMTAVIDRDRAVEQLVWAPGAPQYVRGKLMKGDGDGGWYEKPGANALNVYRAPPAIKGRATADDVKPWLDHLRAIYPDDVSHIVCWFAHRVQRPGEKINHALVLGGPVGIGKDTILEPVRRAVGEWNFEEVTPQILFGRFNGYLKSVVLRVNEARDQGEQSGGKIDRYVFHDHMKILTAAPPETLRVDEKNKQEYRVANVCGIVYTTNYQSALYLPADDRRHYVTWSESTKERFNAGYWHELWGWYERGGYELIAAYLANLDLSGWNAKAEPPRTAAFWATVNADRAPDEVGLSDALDKLGRPPALIISQLAAINLTLASPANWRKVPHQMQRAGYVVVPNPTAPKDPRWRTKTTGKKETVYALSELTVAQRIAAAEIL